MRINIICQECSRQNNNWAVFYIDQIRDDGVYIRKCPKWHSNAVAAQTLRHEMLFEIGLNAIKDFTIEKLSHRSRPAYSGIASSRFV